MGDLILLVLIFTIGAGLMFVLTVTETELKSRREGRQRNLQSPLTGKNGHKIADTPRKPDLHIVRGYDSGDLFRSDSIVRIGKLEREIAADIKEMERNRSKSDTK